MTSYYCHQNSLLFSVKYYSTATCSDLPSLDILTKGPGYLRKKNKKGEDENYDGY